jgi:glycosyltransferase involved in cell wall biosynthesis
VIPGDAAPASDTHEGVGELSDAPQVVCLSTADWDAPLWTNKQHLMSRLAERGVPVLYVDSPGHRTPSPTGQDLRRIIHRLEMWRPTARPVSRNLWRDSPLIIPLHGSPLAEVLNIRLLRARIGRNLRRLKSSRPILWAYSPLAARVASTSGAFSHVVYHCVDDLAQFPGVDAAAFRREEQRTVRLADVTIVSSRPLESHVRDLGATRVLYWPNPADVFAILRENIVRGAPRTNPRVGFLGAVHGHKIDTDLLRAVALALPNVEFLIGGPIGAGIAGHEIDPRSFPGNVTFVGLIKREDVPRFLADLDVGLIPYRINEYTEGVFPMKVFEYYAAGLPVVATPLPSLVGEVAGLRIAGDAETFALAVQEALSEPADSPGEGQRIALARQHSWEARCSEAIGLLSELVGLKS